MSIIEAVVVTANRDHHSMLALGEKDTPARNLFAALVAKRKYSFCERFHVCRGEAAQAALYRAEYDAACERIAELERAAE